MDDVLFCTVGAIHRVKGWEEGRGNGVSLYYAWSFGELQRTSIRETTLPLQARARHCWFIAFMILQRQRFTSTAQFNKGCRIHVFHLLVRLTNLVFMESGVPPEPRTRILIAFLCFNSSIMRLLIKNKISGRGERPAFEITQRSVTNSRRNLEMVYERTR